MKIKCQFCNKIKEGIPKQYNKFGADVCFKCLIAKAALMTTAEFSRIVGKEKPL